MLSLPDRGVGLGNIELAEADRLVFRDVELHVVARGEANGFVDRLEDEFFDKSGDAAVGDHFQGVGFLLASLVAGCLGDVEPDAARPLLDRVGGEAAADGRAGGRAVGEMEAPVVLGALNGLADHDAVGEVGVAVGADTVGGVEPALRVADQREGLLAVVESQDVVGTEIGRRADFEPAVLVRIGFGAVPLVTDRFRGRRQLDFHMVGGVFDLLQNGGDDFFPAFEQAVVGLRHVVFDQGVQLRQVVVRNEREHVVLHMVVHIPIQKAMEDVRMEGPAVETMVEHVLREAGVLREPIHRHQPAAEEVGEADEQQRKEAAQINGEQDHGGVNEDVNTRAEMDLRKLAFGNEGLFILRHAPEGMPDDAPVILQIGLPVEETEDEGLQVRRTRHLDLRVAAHDDSVAVVARVAPAPDDGFAHHHEGGDLVEGVVHPVRPEGCAMPGFVPARVGSRGVEGREAQIRHHRPPATPERDRGRRKAEDEGEPDDRVADGRTVAALQHLAHLLARHRALVPFRFGQPELHRPL